MTQITQGMIIGNVGTVNKIGKPKSCVDCEHFILGETYNYGLWLGCELDEWDVSCVKTEYWFRSEIKRAETCFDFTKEDIG